MFHGGAGATEEVGIHLNWKQNDTRVIIKQLWRGRGYNVIEEGMQMVLLLGGVVTGDLS